MKDELGNEKYAIFRFLMTSLLFVTIFNKIEAVISGFSKEIFSGHFTNF